jgi:hypothetical protein
MAGRRWGAGGILLAMALVGAGSALASDDPIDRESLRALDGVRVAINDVPANAPKELTEDSLIHFVEARLEAAHVPLQRHGEFPVGDPFLRVTIQTTSLTTPEANGLVAYHIDVEFMQIGFIRRNPTLTFNRAQTWSTKARMGLVPAADLVERIREDLAEQIDQFSTAYKSVN